MTIVSIPTWDSLLFHIHTYFYDADIGALEIALSAATSHYHKGADPVWLFILGPSGGDKTSIIVNCLLGMSTAYLMGDLTSKTFLSGYTGVANASLLHQIGSGIMVFKDFTTFISKRPDEQAEIAAQLREVYDGVFKRNCGKGDPKEWHGKMTVLAAATPALERRWSTLGDLGERFLQVRLPRKDGLKQAEYAQKQAGKEEYISTYMRQLATQLMQSTPPITYPPPQLSDNQRHKVSCMAELVAYSRGKVPRDAKGHISNLVEIENSSRCSKELNSLVSGHAALFRRQAIDDTHDMWVAQRVTRNSIPVTRYLVLHELSQYPQVSCPLTSLLSLTRLPESTLRYTLDDLVALGLVHVKESYGQSICELSELCRELWSTGLGLPQQVEISRPVAVLVPRVR